MDPDDRRPIPDPTSLTTEALHREIKHVFELLVEKLDGLQVQINTAESHRKEQKVDTAAQIKAAFDAQKEAADKSEQATEKRLEQLQGRADADTNATRETINALKERVLTIESQGVAVDRRRTESRSQNSLNVAIAGLGVTVLIAIVAYLAGGGPS